jgi:hypothetical protein
MQEKLYFCSALATVLISIYGCAIQREQATNNCPLKDQEIPVGYARDECHCVKNLVQVKESDSEWDREMGRTPKGETTTTQTGNGLSATSGTHTVIPADHTVQCSRTNLTKEAPQTYLPKCGSNGFIRQCDGDAG